MKVITTIELNFAEVNLQEIGKCYNLTIDEVIAQIKSGELSLDSIFDSAWRVEEQLCSRTVTN